jgi:hypothetical protein
MAINSFNALPMAKKAFGGVYITPLEFRIIVAVRHRWLTLQVKARSTRVPY